MKKAPPNSFKDAKNIGSTIKKHLNGIGIFSLAELAAFTPVEAYKKICKQNPSKTFPVCYYLYSLQGALLNIHWDDLPTELKSDLKREAG